MIIAVCLQRDVGRACRQFFCKEGFLEVAPESLPAAKWHGYAPERRQRIRAFRMDLSG